MLTPSAYHLQLGGSHLCVHFAPFAAHTFTHRTFQHYSKISKAAWRKRILVEAAEAEVGEGEVEEEEEEADEVEEAEEGGVQVRKVEREEPISATTT